MREYLRLIRLMLGETRNAVYATRAGLEDQLVRLQAQLAAVDAQLVAVDAVTRSNRDGIAQLTNDTAALAAHRQQGANDIVSRHQQLVEMLRFVHDQGQVHRERLRELRDEPAYQAAYSNSDPLISVVIPTYDNYRLLSERSIPSVLAQTHQNFEIVVVGDHAPEAARLAVEHFEDPRIMFFNLGYRGPYPADPEKRWLVAGVPPYNEAVRRSGGQWIAPLDDDDAFRPTHLERLLNKARDERLELVYARLEVHRAGGAATTIGCFPPAHGEFGLQSALYHGGLARIFELELADSAFDLPYDWGICQRMMKAGVQMGMLDDTTVDYFPSRSWTPRWSSDSDRQQPAVNAEGQFTADGRPFLTAPQPTEPADPPSTSEPSDPPADRPEWEYVPEGWERAHDPAAAWAVGWSAADVARAYREKWPRFLQAVEGPGPLGVSHEVPVGAPISRTDVFAQDAVLAYAFALARAAHGSSEVSILDWGGALGHHYVLGRRLLPEVSLDYHCRELPEVCVQGRALLPEVTFHDTDACLARRYDLVVASGSLQYVSDWRGLLQRLAEATGSWTFVTRVPVAGHPSFVVLQRAYAYGYATEYLGWVLDPTELLAAARTAHLELDREFVILPEMVVAGAPAAVAHAGFLFRTTRRSR